MARRRRKTPFEVLRNGENLDRFALEIILMVVIGAFVLAIPTCSQLLKTF
jgi:hypothetical protein